MGNCNHENVDSHRENARRITIPEAREILQGSICYGPINGPDTTLYNKGDKWYQVILPCLSCLGIREYDDTTQVAEIAEISIEELLESRIPCTWFLSKSFIEM
jgi:hypothetical protein